MIITITGSIGSGKTTVSKLLSDKTEYSRISIGDMQRAVAEEKGLTILELNELAKTDPTIDFQVDDYIKSLHTQSQIIVDSRLAWFFVPNSYKVYIYTNDEVAAERIYNEDRPTEGDLATVGDTLLSIRSRRKSETERFIKLYNIDINDTTPYDLVIDATHKTPDQVVAQIIKNIRRTTHE